MSINFSPSVFVRRFSLCPHGQLRLKLWKKHLFYTRNVADDMARTHQRAIFWKAIIHQTPLSSLNLRVVHHARGHQTTDGVSLMRRYHQPTQNAAKEQAQIHRSYSAYIHSKTNLFYQDPGLFAVCGSGWNCG